MIKYKSKKLVALLMMCVMLLTPTLMVSAASSDGFSKYINSYHGTMLGAIAISSSGSAKGVAANTSVTGTGNNVYVSLEVQNNSTGATLYPQTTSSGSSSAAISTGMVFSGQIGAFSAHEIRSTDGSWGAYLSLAEN